MSGFGNKGLCEVKGMFFDRAGLTEKSGQLKLRFLSKAGAFVMTTARRSIRPARSPSRAGSQPHGHGRQLLKRSIFFGLDAGSDSVFIGPINLSLPETAVTPASGTIPAILESRGQVFIKEVKQYGRWRTYRGQTGLPIRIRRATVAARPFMGPALAVNAPKFPAMLQGQFN